MLILVVLLGIIGSVWSRSHQILEFKFEADAKMGCCGCTLNKMPAMIVTDRQRLLSSLYLSWRHFEATGLICVANIWGEKEKPVVAESDSAGDE